MKNVYLSVPADHEEDEALHPWSGVQSGGEETQLGVKPSTRPQL